MTPIKQEHPKGCFQACIASMLDLSLEAVPDFCAPGFGGRDWWGGFLAWCAGRGLCPVEVYLKAGSIHFAEIPDGVFCVLSGVSPRGNYLHSVIARSEKNLLKIVFDPHESNAGLSGHPTSALFFVMANACFDPAEAGVITPDAMGQITAHVAKSLKLGLRSDVAVQLAVTEFRRLDPVDVAEVAETACEGWKRLQETGPE